MAQIVIICGIIFCGITAGMHTHSIMIGIAVSWGMWIVMPWNNNGR